VCARISVLKRAIQVVEDTRSKELHMTITDKTILITGANRGLGQALVDEALRRGATRVYAASRQPIVHRMTVLRP
jgi:FlaA1/EpsC-like NDP-sugar epimerase